MIRNIPKNLIKIFSGFFLETLAYSVASCVIKEPWKVQSTELEAPISKAAGTMVQYLGN